MRICLAKLLMFSTFVLLTSCLGPTFFGRFEPSRNPGLGPCPYDANIKRVEGDFYYHDPFGREWRCPKDHWVDGASIPDELQWIAGSPWSGRHGNPSIIHDYYCDMRGDGEIVARDGRRAPSWLEVHQQYYLAARCNGMSPLRAAVEYVAIMVGGPKWSSGVGAKLPTELTRCEAGRKERVYTSTRLAARFGQIVSRKGQEIGLSPEIGTYVFSPVDSELEKIKKLLDYAKNEVLVQEEFKRLASKWKQERGG